MLVSPDLLLDWSAHRQVRHTPFGNILSWLQMSKQCHGEGASFSEPPVKQVLLCRFELN